ncbi:MAG TPA: MFS transporter [Thermoanaerobaculia bacterium]|nr:MFS transporter [Thermoanaerobaculia bacterium]
MAKHDPYAPLRIPNFLWILLSYGVTTIGREAQMVVVGWQVYEATRDPLSLGMIGLAEALPFIAVALYAGHIADRASRKWIAVSGTFGLLLSAIALLIFTLRPQTLAHGRVWPIYVVIFLSGIARSFTRPALTALSADVVPRETYASAVAWRSSTWQLAAILGPALGGLLYGFRGAVAAYATVTVLMSAALVVLMLVAATEREPEREEMTIGESLRIGLRFVFRQPVVLGAMSLDLFSVLFGGAVALLPIFARMLGVGPQGLGVLRAAPAVGAVLMGLVIAHRPPMQRAGRSLLVSVAIFGLTIIGFGLSRNFLLSVALLTIGGMADNVSVVIRSTLVQTMTPPNLLGRVSSVNQIFIGSSNEIGAFESGVAARLLGTVPSVIFGGVMTLLVVAITAWRAPQLRRLRRIDDL